eukprot:scaffold1699_cov252-Ochromonas_danica.AAC.8
MKRKVPCVSEEWPKRYQTKSEDAEVESVALQLQRGECQPPQRNRRIHSRNLLHLIFAAITGKVNLVTVAEWFSHTMSAGGRLRFRVRVPGRVDFCPAGPMDTA